MATPSWESGRGSSGAGSSENVWSSRLQWGAILAGSAAGFGVVFLMTLLGAALGITAGTVAGHETQSADADTIGKAVTAFGIGSAIWMLLTAAVTGIVGGWVLNSCSRRDRPYSSFIFGLLTWSVANCAALFMAMPTLGGALSGAGSGIGGAAASVSGRPDLARDMGNALRSQPNQNQGQPQAPMSEQDRAAAAEAAKKAATTATVATWVTLISQLVALGATIIAAGSHRSAKMKVITEIRPRPIPAP